MVRRRRTPPKSTTLTNCFETSFFPRRWRQVKDSALLALSSLGDICRPFVNLASRRSSLDSLLKRNSREDEEEPEPIFGCAIRLRISYYSLDSILFRGNTWNYTRQGWTYPAPGLHEIRSNDVSRPSRYICINCLERRGGGPKSRIIHSRRGRRERTEGYAVSCATFRNF